MVITFDGASGTGKSTLAKLVAKKLNFNFMNSGMIYRAITYYLLTKGISYNEVDKNINELDCLNVDVEFINFDQRVYINNIDYSNHVSDLNVTENVSQFSQNMIIRKIVEKVQKDFAVNNNCIFEGRDLGSVVFPNADYKFYIECNIDVRAQRRYIDLIKNNPSITFNQVKKQLCERDQRDINREVCPLVKPHNAIVIDTSYDTIDESIRKILSYIK